MAELSDAYGQNYQDESKVSRNNYILNNVVNNLAHRQFNFRLFDSNELWDTSNNIPQSIIETLTNKVKTINKYMCLHHLDKKSDQINMIPELIVETPVEYFLMIDGEFHRAYFIYITPYEVSAY
jgi:hypothetical protein